MTRHFDCLIIGGGAAGLTGAIYLARFRRTVLVVDGRRSRAALIPKSRNYPGFANGLSGASFLAALRRQAGRYEIAVKSGEVTDLKIVKKKFYAVTNGSRLSASSILLATGLTDHEPKIVGLQIVGLRKAIARTIVKYCPVCDAYESSGDRIAVLGEVDNVGAKALFLRSYSKNVTIFAVGKSTSGTKSRALRNAGINIFRPVAIRVQNGGAEGIDVNGATCWVDTIYPMLGCDVHSDLATRLGAKSNKTGCLIVDTTQRTSVRGLYAAGDVVSDLHQISVATGHAAIAATAIHNWLPKNPR